MWGQYCETWCEACKTDLHKCSKCGSTYGAGQYHSPDDCKKKEDQLTDTKKPLTKQDIANMTQEQREELASLMLNPVKYCRQPRIDDQCNRWYMHDGVEVSEEEHNQIVNGWWREANPKWSEEGLKHYLLWTKEDQLTAPAHSTLVLLILALQNIPDKADDLLKLALTHFPDVKAYQARVWTLFRAKLYGKLPQICATMREELAKS